MVSTPGFKEFDLIDRAASRAVLTVRDDQYDFPWLLDAAHVVRRRGGRLRLVDSGRSDIVSLVWLAEAGAHVFSSDEARPDPQEIIPVRLSGRRSGALTFYYIHGPHGPGSTPAGFWAGAAELGRSGGDLHLSNRAHARPAGVLADLAVACRHGRGRLVYYHLGALEPALETLAEAGAWLHGSNKELDPAGDLTLVHDILVGARRAGGGFVLHIEEPWPSIILRDLLERGAFLQFHTPLGERGSDWRRLEAQSARHRPDARAFYLQPDFLL